METLFEKKYLKTIGQNVRIFRTAREMTQLELAKKADVGLSAITAIEAGNNISLENLFKLAHALNVSPADFFVTDEERKQITYKTKLLVDKLTELMGIQTP